MAYIFSRKFTYFLFPSSFSAFLTSAQKIRQKLVKFDKFSLDFGQILVRCRNFVRKSEKQKMKMEKENEYDFARMQFTPGTHGQPPADSPWPSAYGRPSTA